MERASCNCALRVRSGVAVSSFSVVIKGIVSEGENEGAGGSCTRDNAICRCAFLLFWLRWAGAGGFGLRLSSVGSGRLAAVVAAFARGLPGDRGKGALEEGVVDDVALVIFAFDDPVAGIGFALSGVCEDGCGVEALRGVDEKGPAGAKRVHEAFSWRPYSPPKLFQHLIRKKDVIVFVDFRKGFLSLFCWDRCGLL